MLNYRAEGGGPPILLLHGFGISFNIWTELIPLLRGRFSLVTVELPGIGLSPSRLFPTPYLAAAVDALDSLRVSLAIPRWDVLSYSSGTRVAEAYLQTHADRVKRAVFLAPAYTTKGKAFGLRVASAIDARFPALGDWTLSGARLRFLIRLLGFNLRADPSVDAWFSEIASQPREILKATLRSLPGFGARPLAVPANVPALFVWGSEDLITKTPRRLSARDVVIPATHAMPQSRAREVGEIFLSYLE